MGFTSARNSTLPVPLALLPEAAPPVIGERVCAITLRPSLDNFLQPLVF